MTKSIRKTWTVDTKTEREVEEGLELLRTSNESHVVRYLISEGLEALKKSKEQAV